MRIAPVMLPWWRAGPPRWGGGLREQAFVLGAVVEYRLDDEDGGLMEGQIGIAQDLVAEVERLGTIIDGVTHV